MARKKGKNRNWNSVFLWRNRGLSTVVLTLILVLVVVVLGFILWTPIKKMIQTQSEIAGVQEKFFTEQINIIGVNFNDPFINVTMRKPAGQIKPSSVNITLSGGEQRLDVDIFSVVDLSGSMRQCTGITGTQCSSMGGVWNSPVCTSLDFSDGPSCISYGGAWSDRLTATQDANKDMITTLLGVGETKIGLVAYRNNIYSPGSIGLTNNVVQLNNTINSWQASSTTCICCGINNASARLKIQSTQEKFKSIIVMSDGEANVECLEQPNSGDLDGDGVFDTGKDDAILAACQANASLKNVIIYSVGVEGADETTLTRIATCGGGRYFSVANASELIDTYRRIVEDIQTKFESITSLAYLYIMFYNETDRIQEKIPEIPGILETKTYSFNLQGKLSGTLKRIEIYPVIISASREEVIGPMLDYWIMGG